MNKKFFSLLVVAEFCCTYCKASSELSQCCEQFSSTQNVSCSCLLEEEESISEDGYEVWKIRACLLNSFSTLYGFDLLGDVEQEKVLQQISYCSKYIRENGGFSLDALYAPLELLFNKHWEKIKFQIEGNQINKCSLSDIMDIVSLLPEVAMSSSQSQTLIDQISKIVSDAKIDIKNIVSSESSKAFEEFGRGLTKIIEQRMSK
ncbi:MAG: hypothetical protein LBS83_01775 [Holosporales bacterium]|jgi:hypothetical protein|nr:hypothetical protein [Holosporales bacterium]